MDVSQTFTREMNPGFCPIDLPTDNAAICSPAECTFKATYATISSSNDKVQTYTYKRTHNIDDIAELWNGSNYAEAFAGGTYLHWRRI
jgi:hypothetical protein